MVSAQAVWLLAIYCLVVHAAITPSKLSPSPSPEVRPRVSFQKYKPSGTSIWKTLFSQSNMAVKCPSGFVLQRNKCVPKTSKPARLLQQLDPIRSYIWPWYTTPIGSTLTGGTTPGGTQIQSEDPYQICKVRVYDFTNPTEDLVNVDSNMDVLFPGSFVQSRYVSTGAESLVSLPVGQDKRHPIRLASGDGNFAPFDVTPPTAGQVHYAIKQSILASSGFSSGTVYYDLTTSDSIEQLVINFNFNAKILKKLDLEGGFTGNWQTRKKKYILTMIQKINTYFPDMFVRTPGEFADAIGVFLNPEFNLAQANRLKDFDYWGINNPPLYISEVYYGRMIVVTVDQNEYTSSIYAQLQASTGTASAELSVNFTKLFQDASKKVFSIGPFSEVDLNQLTSGSWQNFFSQVPSDNAMVQALKPIGFRLKDWMLRPVKVSNLLQYNTLICEPKPSRTIVVKLSDVYEKAFIQIRKPGQAFYTPISMDQSGGDITTYLANGDNQLRIQNEVGRKWGIYQRKVKFQLLINGTSKYGPSTNDCKFCHSTGGEGSPQAAFYCYNVNKYVGNPTCQNVPN